jgi:hypothetical protein
MEYEVAHKLYRQLADQRPDVLSSLQAAIDDHAATTDWVRGDWAGAKLLSDHDEFTQFCGEASGQVFGIVLKEHLVGQGWTIIRSDDNGKPVTYYKKP